jgi:KaiC/GvpD/RAD55 family RecA-like ATPase
VKAPTGIKRLDDLLKGGLPERSVTLVHGPPFIGKEALAHQILLTGMHSNLPGIIITTDHTAAEVRKHLATMDAKYSDLEKKGLALFVDAYSKSIGGSDEAKNVEYVDGLMNLNALSVALNNAQRKIIREHESHTVLFDSVSTLVAYTNAQTAFRFLQVLVGKAKAAGAATILLLEEGMHTPAEVKTFKHLSDGVIEVKSEKASQVMHVEGNGLTQNPGWVEYRFDETGVQITGSFGAGRIR